MGQIKLIILPVFFFFFFFFFSSSYSSSDRARPTGCATTAAHGEKDCKALAGEYVIIQHKPVVFEVRMKKLKEKRTMVPKHIKWWMCKGDLMIEYRERMRRKYEELDAEKGTVEGELRQYIGVVEELRDRTSGKGGTPRSRNQGWWTEEMAKAVGETPEAWKMIECIMGRGEQTPTGLRHMHGQRKKAAITAVDRARRSMEEELY